MRVGRQGLVVRRRLILALATVASLGLLGPNGLANAETVRLPEPPAVAINMDSIGLDSTIQTRQNVLDPAADQVRKFALIQDADFSDVGVDAVTNKLTIYRRGALDDSMRAQYHTAATDAVSIDFQPAVITEAERDSLDRWLTSNLAAAEKAGVLMNEWGTDHLGGQFVIWYTGTSPESFVQTEITTLQLPADTLTYVERKPVSSNARIADTSPYYGGSRIVTGGSGCSTGFAVKGTNGADYLITAWHCFSPSSPNAYTAGNNGYIGAITSTYAYADISYIKVLPRNGVPQYSDNFVFSGAYQNDDSNYTVTGWQNPNANDYLCASGAYSYARCNVQLGTGRTWTVTGAAGTATAHGSEIHSTNGQWITGAGDSGGPIYRYVSNETSVNAYGIDSAGLRDGVGCPSWQQKCDNTGRIGLARDAVSNNGVNFINLP